MLHASSVTCLRLVCVGVNGELRYGISHGNEERLFTVDERTGVVTVARRLDPVCGRSFHLVISVTDRGTPPRLALADLVVTVNDTASASAALSRPGTVCTPSGRTKRTSFLLCASFQYLYVAFSVAGPMTWNSLPDFIRDPTSSTDCFRRLLKTYLLARY